MKNINRIIRHKILEITIAFLIIIVSFPVWTLFGDNHLLKLASTYANSSLVCVDVSNYQNYQFYPIKDQSAMKHLVPMKVTLYNETILSSSYFLVLAVNKSSSLKYEAFKISVNDQIFFLNELYLKEDSTNYYFSIAKGDLQASNKTFFINLWLHFDVQNNEIEQSFYYDFLNLDSAFLI